MNSNPLREWACQFEYRDEVQRIRTTPATTLLELARERFHGRIKILEELGIRLGEVLRFELVDPDNSERTKPLQGGLTLEDAGLWEGAHVRFRLTGALDVELIDENDEPRKMIIPTMVTVARLTEFFSQERTSKLSEGVAYYLHLLDPSLPGGLRRLPSESTLSEFKTLITSRDRRLFILPQLRDLQQRSIAAKGTLASVYLINHLGESRHLPLSLDISTDGLEDLARSLHRDEPISEFTIEIRGASRGPDPPPYLSPSGDLEVYSGPDRTVFSLLGILRAGQASQVTGRDQATRWWEISYPPESDGRGWIERRKTDELHPSAVPVVAPPRILRPGVTLWQEGVRQDPSVLTWVQIRPKLTLFQTLTRKLGEHWEARRITIRTNGLLVRFLERELPRRTEIYLRAIGDDLYFQLPLLHLPPLPRESRIRLFESLQQREADLTPLTLALDEEKCLLLCLSMDQNSFLRLRSYDIDPLKMMSAAASLKDDIRVEVKAYLQRGALSTFDLLEGTR